jgi:hypothetical protein
MTKLAQSREIIRQVAAQRDLPQLLIRVGQAPAPVVERVATPRPPSTTVGHRFTAGFPKPS